MKRGKCLSLYVTKWEKGKGKVGRKGLKRLKD